MSSPLSEPTSPPVTTEPPVDTTSPPHPPLQGSQSVSRLPAAENSLPAPPARLPNMRISSDSSASPNMTKSSTPLGGINAARRPAPSPSTVRPGGLPVDMAEKLKAFHLSRRGTPTAPGPGALPSPQPQRGPVGGPLMGSPAPGGPPTFAAPTMPPSMPRPAGTNARSTPAVPRVAPKLGGLAAKRGLNQGMSLTNAMKVAPAASSTGEGVQDKSEDPEKPKETETVFSKYSEYVDTAAGTIKFKDKAIIHGSGIDFSGGSSFSISLDEVDTLDELGKGNYGTVYCVRHSRPRVRRRGLGLAGNKDPHSSAIAKTADTSSTQRDGTTGLVMAMKEIRLELDDAKFAAIIMELDVLHRCVSPFIVDFYGAFFQEGAVYICMEFMDGGSIDKLYGDGIPENVLRKIVLSSVMGLKSLKDDHNIIHRDVKPTNILVNTRGQVKICDFGVSGNLVASIAKTNIGCQSYMAPERIAGGGIAQAGANPGGGTYSVQSDIWSLGLTVVECAMGRYPYPPETYNNIFSQLSAIVEGDPPGLPAEGFSPAAHNFVASCLHKVPKSRPTYAMLLRDPWLSPLLQPPTISEDAEAEAAAETGTDSASASAKTEIVVQTGPSTADEDIATWARAALEKKRLGKLRNSEKPALHAAPLDAVPSPAIKSGSDDTAS